jgi:hypothetical protein
MKTCGASIKQSIQQGLEKGTRGKDPSLGKKKKPPMNMDCKKKSSMKVDCKRNMNKSSNQTPRLQGAYEVRRGEEHLKEHLV